MIIFGIVLCLSLMAQAGPATEVASYKGQFCTDPRTMRKHAAYTEWADAYSCTRHRCQPGGRNLAIYTVGCKRVEAPESAIECEEVVEDTNMQFPYCCTRLRCLVVVRGEVWTRVLGQPWETLPAAPWSHMYKMKKPPPGDGTFPKKVVEGPVYELSVSDNERDASEKAVLRSSRKEADCETTVPRAAQPPPGPDIVIALSTGSEKETERKKEEEPRQFGQRQRKEAQSPPNNYYEDTQAEAAERNNDDVEETVTEKEKPSSPQSEERYYGNSYSTESSKPQHLVSWTEVPQPWNDVEQPAEDHDLPPHQQQRSLWNDPDPDEGRRAPDAQESQTPTSPAQTWEHQSNPNPGAMEYTPPEEKEEKKERPGNLQTLVDAIGNRMRDIETVVARMSEKVHQDQKQVQVEPDYGKGEPNDMKYSRSMDTDHQYHERKSNSKTKLKKPSTDNQYKRFSGRGSRGSQYLRSKGDITTEPPLFVEDSNLNGFYSDASNSLLNRRVGPKEPPATYMAPVEIDTRRKMTRTENPADEDKKHKKRVHKKKKTKGSKSTKGHHKKHHGKEDKRRKFKSNSVELDRQTSLEDSSAQGTSTRTNNTSTENTID